MTSERLPGKVLMEICNKPLVLHITERLAKCKNIEELILAMPDTIENDILEEYAKQHHIEYFRGSENDVLSRYLHAAEAFRVDNIVRITADCPLIDPRIVDVMVDSFVTEEVHCAAVGVEGDFARGFDAEIFDYYTLKRVNCEAQRFYEREHVTPYIYENPNLFRVFFLKAEGKLKRPNMRLTVDTIEDLKLAKKVFENFSDKDMFYAEDVIDFLDANPKLLSINACVTQKEIGEL